MSLKGWYLSNDPYNLTRWAFPDSAVIAKNGYLVVYCAGSEPVTDGLKNALYADYKRDRDEMRQLLIVQENVRRILDTDPQQEQDISHRHIRF